MMPVLLEHLQWLAHQTAKDKGWWDEPRSIGEQIALMHSELSEALEEVRGAVAVNRIYYNPETPAKPEGFGIELADCVIRIFDTCERYGINLEHCLKVKMEYNKTRPHRHGGKLL